MHVAVGFMPAFKYRQKNFLIVLERGHKAHGYVSAGERPRKFQQAARHSRRGFSVTGDLLIWTGLRSIRAWFFKTVADRPDSFDVAGTPGIVTQLLSQ